MPRSSPRWARAIAVATLLAGTASVAVAAPVRTIAIDEVRPGMTGYGLTVFRGTKPERFEIKVIDVLRRFLPRQDIILIESDDARLKHMGIVAGMSGSPIYLRTTDGERLAGALAYGWHFAKDPIAGVTPIANMLAELERPLRGRANTPGAAATNDPPYRDRAPEATMAHRGESSFPSLVPATVPLSISGCSPRVFNEMAAWLEPWGVTPMAAGGGGGGGGGSDKGAGEGPAQFEPGSAIAVQLIRGDMSAAGTGTVTWVDGDKVLAFGHPMFNLGELYIPVATAEVHAVMAAVSSSFKMASPIREIGTLVQDRQSCIVADTSHRSDMIPVRVRVGAAGRPDAGRTFNAEVLRHRFLTPLLASTVVANAVQTAASDVTDATFTVRTSLGVRGEKPLEVVDHAFSADGLSQRTVNSLSGLKAIGDLLFNPFQPTNLERIDVQVEVEYKADVAEITALALGSDTLEPGSRPSLRVTLRPYNGPDFVQSVPLDIPASLAGSLVKIEVAAGNLVKPDQAPPESLHALVENLRKGYPARSIVVSLQTADDTLALRGALLTDLPSSVLDTLRPGASTRKGDTFKLSTRTVVPTRGVVLGKQELQVKVRDATSF